MERPGPVLLLAPTTAPEPWTHSPAAGRLGDRSEPLREVRRRTSGACATARWQPCLSLLLRLGKLPHRGPFILQPNDLVAPPELPCSVRFLADRKRNGWDGHPRKR